ncbi:MAG: tyrosine-type recombinase/integrase [Candidatus Sulfotelmatobacter sp.]|jgi:site-specific recombinase XerD
MEPEGRKAPARRAQNLKGSWSVGKNNLGLSWEEAETSFLRSRKLGIFGAAKAVRPRTIQEYKWDLGQFFNFMRARQVEHYNQLTDNLVLQYLEHLQSNGWAVATVRKYLISLKAFFRWVDRDPDCRAARMHGYQHIMPKIGREVRRSFIPSQQQMEAFAQGFDQTVVWGLRDYTALCFMLDTGARIGEVCNLEWDDFKTNVNLVNLDGKTGERLVPYSAETTGQLLRNWMRARIQFAHPECKKLFITRFGGACTPDTFRQAFTDNLKRTGLDKILGDNTISCHTVRHYFCTLYLANGGTLHNLQKITGHRNLNTLMIYVHMAQQMTSVAEEASRVSPLKSLLEGKQLRKRNVLRLGH